LPRQGTNRRRYRLVQVHSLPDVLVFAAAVPRLLGARLLLDLQECMPEFFATPPSCLSWPSSSSASASPTW
jgi:hypothetical protein